MLKPHWSEIKKLRINVNFKSVSENKRVEDNKNSPAEVNEEELHDEEEQMDMNENAKLYPEIQLI